VLLSGVRKDDESISQGIEAGADGYLTKPIDERELRTWVRATLRISSLEREVSALSAGAHREIEEVIGQFAGLSHSVNNALQALYANTELLALELGDSERGKALVAEILAQTEKAATLVTQASVTARQHALRLREKESRRATKTS